MVELRDMWFHPSHFSFALGLSVMSVVLMPLFLPAWRTSHPALYAIC